MVVGGEQEKDRAGRGREKEAGKLWSLLLSTQSCQVSEAMQSQTCLVLRRKGEGEKRKLACVR